MVLVTVAVLCRARDRRTARRQRCAWARQARSKRGIDGARGAAWHVDGEIVRFGHVGEGGGRCALASEEGGVEWLLVLHGPC